VACEQLQHVIKKADAGGDFVLSAALNLQFNGNASFR
jgi:hypothetical protein